MYVYIHADTLIIHCVYSIFTLPKNLHSEFWDWSLFMAEGGTEEKMAVGEQNYG